MTDTQWSPAHPSVLGAIDASGGFHVYDFLRDADKPAVSFSPTQRGLTSMRFSPAGAVAACGDVSGVVALTRLTDDLVVPRGDEAQRLRTMRAASSR